MCECVHVWHAHDCVIHLVLFQLAQHLWNKTIQKQKWWEKNSDSRIIEKFEAINFFWFSISGELWNTYFIKYNAPARQPRKNETKIIQSNDLFFKCTIFFCHLAKWLNEGVSFLLIFTKWTNEMHEKKRMRNKCIEWEKCRFAWKVNVRERKKAYTFRAYSIIYNVKSVSHP